MTLCPCCSEVEYDACCGPMIRNEKTAETAEQLMRSRYTAYVTTEIDYLNDTTHPDHREDFDKKAARDWSKNAKWKKLEILGTENGGPEDSQGVVEFAAYFNLNSADQRHHERAEFKKEDGQWFFTDGHPVKPSTIRREGAKIGRNDPCPCGSGKKYKKCCG